MVSSKSMWHQDWLHTNTMVNDKEANNVKCYSINHFDCHLVC